MGVAARRWLRRNAVPCGATAGYVVVGMVLSFWWWYFRKGPGMVGVWHTPGDFWDTYVTAVNLVHGHVSQIYSPQSILVTFPGITVALAPVAALTSALHWPLGPPQQGYWSPVTWLVAGPWMLVLGSLPIFASNSLAARWGWSGRRRIGLCVVEALVLLDVTAWWGHPEDAVAVGLVLYAALAGDEGADRRMALLLGLAICMQPLALLAAAPLLARLDWRRLWRLAPSVIGPSLIVLAAPLVAELHTTLRVLFEQPNYPWLNHVTPLTSLATRLSPASVSAGPWRLVGLAVAAGLGVATCRRRAELDRVLAVMAASFLIRVAFETVVAGYYLWPVLAVGLILAGRRGTARFVAFALVSVGETLFQQVHLPGVWTWWCLTLAPTAAALVLVLPPRVRSSAAVAEPERLLPV